MAEADPKAVYLELAYPESEPVFGLVYPVGTDDTGVSLTLENYIKGFGYKPNPRLAHKWRGRALAHRPRGLPS